MILVHSINEMVPKFLIVLVLFTVQFVNSGKYESLNYGKISDDPEWPSHGCEYENESNENNYVVCQTPECIQVAEEFLSSMNTTVNPCEDFYEFSCGGWSTSNPIPPSLPNWSRFMIFENTVNHRIKGILETALTPNDILPIRQAKKWYRSCINNERLAQSIEPIASVLFQNGGWPMAMDEDEWMEDENWQNIDHQYAHLTGSYVLYEINSEYASDELPEINILPAELPLSNTNPLNSRHYNVEYNETYARLLEEVVQLFAEHNRASISKLKIREEVEKLIEFEREIYQLKDTTRDGISLNIDEFLSQYDCNMTEMNANLKTRIDWKSMIENLFKTVNINIDPSMRLYFSNMAYVEKIPSLLNRTSIRTIVNYIHWKFVGNMLMRTDEKIRNKFSTFLMKDLNGVTEGPPRWLYCIDEMKMTHAAAYAFVEKYFTKSRENAAAEMVRNIRNEFARNIDESNWLDDESKVLMRNKLDDIHILIGYPDWYKNKTAIVEYYEGLSIGTGFFDNILSHLRYERKQQLKRYKTRKEKSLWYMNPITVNAIYDFNDNALNMPAVVFQSPLFSQGLPNNINYGTVGALIGHEIGHAFDNRAIRIGNNGNVTELSEKMLDFYFERVKCFVDQFNAYHGEANTPNELLWNCKDNESVGKRTAPENIADGSGLRAVYQAYEKSTEKKLADHTRLPGLEEFTNEQLFFISFANMWCEIETLRFSETKDRSRDPHSPVRLRVNGALSNMHTFAKAFNCPTASTMNPYDKCDIWKKLNVEAEVESGFGGDS